MFFCVAETKIDDSFPESQFMMDGFQKPFRLDKNCNSGGLMCFVRNDIPTRRLCNFSLPLDIQLISLEINLRKEKWLFVFIYRPPNQNLPYFIETLSNQIDFYSVKYDNVIVTGDFNELCTSTEISSFMTKHDLQSLLTTPTCFKSVNGRCIDLILTNRKDRFRITSSLETGLSDHHHLVYSMLKTKFDRRPPIKQSYRSFKNFSLENFRSDLSLRLSMTQPGIFSIFNSTLLETIEYHAPLKTRVLRGNNKPHVNKTLRKAIMKRSRLKNIANRTGSSNDYVIYKKQRNVVTKMNEQLRKRFFSNIGNEDKSGKKCFWKTCKPLFSQKSVAPDARISLIENDHVISDDVVVANIFNDYFVNITTALPIFDREIPMNDDDISISSIVLKYKDHPSVLKIASQCSYDNFHFPHIEPWEIVKAINELDASKSTSGLITTKLLQEIAAECYIPITDCINSCINDGVFPDELKFADVVPVHKGQESTCKENYRPISILPVLSKVVEKVIAKHISSFMEKRLSNLLCGFRSKFGTQHALFRLIQQWESCLDKSGKIGAILMDLSKAFDSLPHDLLIAKLAAYGFGKSALKLIKSYLSNRYQRTKVGSSFSTWLSIVLGVPQGSILGPLLFNIFINDLLYFVKETEVCNFADDNTIYSCSSSLDLVIRSLESELCRCLTWFDANKLVTNPNKFQLIFLGVDDAENFSLCIGESEIRASNHVKLLGIYIDNQLKFDAHINKLCETANKKIKCIYRIRRFIDVKQALALCDAYVLSWFRYCSIIWMFCNKTLGRKLSKLHERCMRAVFCFSDLSIQQEMEERNIVPIHSLHLQSLIVEIFKSLHSLNPSFMKSFFVEKPLSFNLRDPCKLLLPHVRTIKYGTNSILFRSIILWNSLPAHLKAAETVSSFKSLSKKITIKCTCQLCSS